jgi:hypothetical protein
MPEDEVRRRYVTGADLAAKVERVRMAAYHGIREPLISTDASKWVHIKCTFIPIGRMELGSFYTVGQLRDASAQLRFGSGASGGQHPVPLVQGLLIRRDGVGGLGQFWLVQRDGSFVWVDTITNSWLPGCERNPTKPLFPRYEIQLNNTLEGLKNAFNALGVSQPIAVCLSLANAQGAAVPPDLAFRFSGTVCIHDEVHAPAIVVDSPELLTAEALKPACDVIMNAFGIDASVSHLKSYA